MPPRRRFRPVAGLARLDRRLLESVALPGSPVVVEVCVIDDPLPDPEPSPGADPGLDTPPPAVPLPPSGPIGPGTS